MGIYEEGDEIDSRTYCSLYVNCPYLEAYRNEIKAIQWIINSVLPVNLCANVFKERQDRDENVLSSVCELPLITGLHQRNLRVSEGNVTGVLCVIMECL
jgi:hypothetical protein